VLCLGARLVQLYVSFYVGCSVWHALLRRIWLHGGGVVLGQQYFSLVKAGVSFCVLVPFRVACGWVASMAYDTIYVREGRRRKHTFWSRAWGDCAVQSVKARKDCSRQVLLF
jgi:hypothetical protein